MLKRKRRKISRKSFKNFLENLSLFPHQKTKEKQRTEEEQDREKYQKKKQEKKNELEEEDEEKEEQFRIPLYSVSSITFAYIFYLPT